MTNDLKQRVTDAQVEVVFDTILKSFQSRSWEFGPPRGDIRDALEAALSVSSSGEATCPICLEQMKAVDICASDIELGICHAACLEGSPVVDLETGEPSDGPATTFRYGGDEAEPAAWLVEGEGPDGKTRWIATTNDPTGLYGPAMPIRPLYAHPSPSSVQTGVAAKVADHLTKIADASRREDGSDIPLGATCREAARILSALSSAPAPSIEELRGALEPFSDAATYYNDKAGNDIGVPIALRHLRRARELFGRLARNSDTAGEGK